MILETTLGNIFLFMVTFVTEEIPDRDRVLLKVPITATLGLVIELGLISVRFPVLGEGKIGTSV